MKIVLDLRIYGPRPGGLGRYNQRLLEELVKLDRYNHYILIFKEKPDDLPTLPDNFRYLLTNCHWYSWREQLVIPWLLYKIKPDLVHWPHFNVPILYRGKFIVTIHDLIMTKFPSRRATTHSRWWFYLKYCFYNLVIKSALQRAWLVIAITEFGKKDLIKYFHLDARAADKIKVVYEGSSTFDDNTLAVDLPKKFFLYVGNAYPHKNLDFLIKVFKKFLANNPDYYLFLVGQKNYFYERLEKENQQLLGSLHPQVIFSGFVADKYLSSYYRQAQAYVFPSLYEGFGLPPLEAMAYGTPVLASSASCLPEVLGSAALYFDPHDESSLLNALYQVSTDESLRKNLVAAGYRQIKKYSWQQMTQDIVKIYNSLS